MPPKRSTARQLAVELCKKFPKTPSRTLAKRLADELRDAGGNLTMSVETARNAIRVARGAHGARYTKYRDVDRPHGKAGQKPAMPPSIADDWTPHVINGKRIAVVSDIHVPYHSTLAVERAVTQLRTLKPDTLLINGDFADFYTISRWTKDPRKRDFKLELVACREMLDWLQSQFPRCEIIYKKGNHEERWDHWLWNHAPEIADCEEMTLDHWFRADERGITIVGDGRPVMCGKLPVFHGHELPKGMTNPVNMARGAFLRMVDTTLVGHGHRSSSHTEATWSHKEITCWSTGCLCDLTPEYARINKWNWGFAFVEVSAGGDFNVSNYRINSHGDVRKS